MVDEVAMDALSLFGLVRRGDHGELVYPYSNTSPGRSGLLIAATKRKEPRFRSILATH